MKKIYKAGRGKFISNKQAQVYGEYLAELSKEKKNQLTAQDVVNDARNTKSPIHDYFEWDDSMAAEKYRLEQARCLIRSIDIVVTYQGEEKPVRAIVCVEYSGREAYVPIQVVAKNADLRQQIIEKALSEIISWQGRYETYKELGLIFGAIKQTQQELRL